MGYKVKIQETNRGQKVINIPKVVAELFKLQKGSTCEWVLERGEILLKIATENQKL